MVINTEPNLRIKSNLKIATLMHLLESTPSSTARNSIASFICSLLKGSYLWDPWILRDGDIYRLFYLTAPKQASWTKFWSQGTIYGAVSTDLQDWKSTGIVLEPEPANEWESARIMAGSTYKEDGIYYLFYSASGGGELLNNERIGLATSIDGLNWKRYSPNPLLSADDHNHWYGRQKDNGRFHWRDPYIIRDYITSKYYMFFCAHLKHETISRYQGCIGLAVSDSISGPYELLPPVSGPTVSEAEEWPFVEMERPQVICRNGKYHLFFSCWPWHLSEKWIKKYRNRIRESSLYWFTSDSITGPFKPENNIPVVKGSEKTGMYATNFLRMKDESEEYIAIGWYHRIFGLQVSSLFRVHFDDELIEIRRAYR